MKSKKYLLYVVPDLRKVSGGPSTRISQYMRIFQAWNQKVILGSGWNKIRNSIGFSRYDLIYVESATNRISLADWIALFFLKHRSDKRIVFIRDIYIELFPDEYLSSFRKKITYKANKFSNRYLTRFSTKLAFPTVKMGEIFFAKNPKLPKKEIIGLPPGTIIDISAKNQSVLVNFEKKPGILYLGSVSYLNSGFERFVRIANQLSGQYNFFVLSGAEAKKAIEKINPSSKIMLDKVPHSEIKAFLHKNNIAFAIHTRPRNEYDDVTFPIKVLDFISLKLPFISEDHEPIVELMGRNYPLFCTVSDDATDLEVIEKMLSFWSNTEQYEKLLAKLEQVAKENTYEKRFEKIIS